MARRRHSQGNRKRPEKPAHGCDDPHRPYHEEKYDAFEYRFTENRDVIRRTSDPFSTSGGPAVLRGNLTPKTGISKPTAIDPAVRQLTGSAKVYDCDDGAAIRHWD